ncbi:SDR family oxidoreductase [Aeromicrobium senzhongii]|uniref:SDR family oxidoreductase n=1 Tax=Aeromicrobium senzhongii TaxID=2663859 RepID=A0ABX6SSS5_9ACTN|nr:SDR family NAD(P)-dependent oxidoreductase [Aeromicrobium senzhongii]MTB88959.1 SDR family oxidoreductase [Aeromicrobium senzhongii]QNL93760.1 SDR family oxidoreductase [Aeromicrobium senzhongii]
MKRALITGAASGIGADVAATLTRAGWESVRTDVKSGEDVVALDVTDPDAWARVLSEHGPFDALVNSAGIRERARLLEVTLDQWERTMAVNLTGTFLGMQAFARTLVESGRPGSIVNVASVNAEKPVVGQPHYCASKAGVAMLTRASALELARHQIRVNAIAPGAIHTPMLQDRLDDPGQEEALVKRIPRRRLGLPSEISAGVEYLLSDGADYVTGVVLPIDGGFLLT